MALAFSGTGQLLSSTAAPAVTAPTFSVACWFKTTNVTARQNLFCLGNSGNTTQSHELAIDGTLATPAVVAASQQTGTTQAVATVGYTSGVWGHACGVWNSATDRRAYFNGTNRGNETTSRIPASLDRTAIAAHINSAGTSALFAGSIADLAVWNVTLSDNEVLNLSRGISPLRVRSSALVLYVPLLLVSSPQPDYTKGQRTFTVTGSPTVDSGAIRVGSRWGYQDGYAATANPAPTATALHPPYSTTGTSAGTNVTIVGTGFKTGATVKISGSSSFTNVVVVSATSITATTPAAPSGTGTYGVTVTNTDGQAATNLSLDYNVPPTVSSASPNNGPAAGGTAVTLAGTNFLNPTFADPGFDFSSITFGGAAATGLSWGFNSFSCTTPAHAPGLVDVVFTNLDNRSVTLVGGYTYTGAAGGKPNKMLMGIG